MLKPWLKAGIPATTGLALLVAGSLAQAADPAKIMDHVGPTDPEMAKLLGLHTQKGMFVLLRDQTADVASLAKPKHFRVCILSGSEPAKVVFETSYLVTKEALIVTPNAALVAADQKVVNDEKTVTVQATHCADVEGQRIKVMPVSALGGQERIRGTYEPVK